MMKLIAAYIASLAGTALCQSSLNRQCGEQGFSGSTVSAGEASASVSISSLSLSKSSSPSLPSSTDMFPSISDTLFTIDGKTEYFAGTNCYWCSFQNEASNVVKSLSEMQSAGLKIVRVWGFSDITEEPTENTQYFQYLNANGSHINNGTNGLQLLDQVVAAAEAHDMKVIINFVNNWGTYGGIPAYVTAFGGDRTTWFTNEAAQSQYQAYIKAVISRYIDSSAILAWELANEPRCRGCDTSVIYRWASKTSAYIKSLDPKHLVTLGDEGFGLSGGQTYPYTTDEGVDWEMNLNITTLDFATMHFYPSQWGVSDCSGNSWIANHAALCEKAGKPCLLEEYGTLDKKCSVEGQWQKTSLSLAAKGMAADTFWQFGTQLKSSKSPDDGYTIYYNSSDWTCLVTDHGDAIRA